MKFTSEITVRLIQSMGSDAAIAAAARVSTHGNDCIKWHDEKVEGLINYLMKHRHGTPFEHSAATFFVNAPIFVWREWHRHRIGFSYNEESARYKTLDPVFYIPDRERPMMKVDNWKPGKPKFTRCEEQVKYDALIINLKHCYTQGYQCYLANLEMGFDPGLARDCLPVGIYSSCWVTCNPRSIMSFLSLRTQRNEEEAMFPSYPLWEIQLAAEQVETIFRIGWPLTYKAWINNKRVAP